MKTARFALAAALLGASLSTAFAEPRDPATDPVRIGTPVASVLVEGRQAAPIVAAPVAAESFVIDRNARNDR